MEEDKFVMLFKELFGINFREYTPNDFDAWTVKKQCDWIKQNVAKFFPNVPQSLLHFIPAMFCQLNYDRSSEKLPKWINMDKYRRGQKFVQKHCAALIISTLIGFMYAYTMEEGLKALLLGELSHTPFLGFRRLLSTMNRLLSWYSEDPWIKGTKAYKDMQVARSMHMAMKRKLCQMSHEQIDTACKFANPWSPDRELLLKDFAAVCSPEKFRQRPYIMFSKPSPYRPNIINNANFEIIQSCFLIVPLLYPQNIGIYYATDEDLEGFCHMWKCYGYFLGLEDEYNLCRGNLKEIKQRVRDLYEYWLIQNLKELTPEWEHVTKCFFVSLNYYPLIYISWKVMILLATDALSLSMPHLYASLSYAEWIVYKTYKFLFSALKFSSVRVIFNKVLLKIMDKATNFDAEKLAELHEKSKKIVPDFSLTS